MPNRPLPADESRTREFSTALRPLRQSLVQRFASGFSRREEIRLDSKPVGEPTGKVLPPHSGLMRGRLHKALGFLLLNILIHPLFAHAQSTESQTKEADQFQTVYEASGKTASADYLATIDFYRRLAETYDRVEMRSGGPTDSGFPLHVVFIAEDAPEILKTGAAETTYGVLPVASRKRGVLLINNAIHPGEPDGVDASMMLARDLARDGLPGNVIVAIIPMYNIGGALNRNSTSRVNQNGPEAYGFRGNAQNYDLNRDFIKCDTRNARSFSALFQALDPDVLIDTHVSNGADYQHVITSAHSQKDKLGGEIGDFFENQFQPQLFEAMSRSGFDTIPYVNSGGSPPDRGFAQFLESPRYSTGYAALFQTMGFMTETHMLKPYPQRVAATRSFLDHAITLLSKHADTVREKRLQDRQAYSKQKEAAIAWSVDRDTPSKLLFRGYEARQIPSRVTSGQRLFYDRQKPFEKEIDYYDRFVPSRTVALPKAYVVPRGWGDVIERLKLNGVELKAVPSDLTVEAEVYRIEQVDSRSVPYEGHFLHSNVEVTLERRSVKLRAGDFVAPIDQPRARYLVETLEPAAMDSFFRWNFFDTVLQQKEHYSSYVFEDLAEKILEEDPKLREKYDAKRESDRAFAESPRNQLEFLYRNSPHYEAAHRTYPVTRLFDLDFLNE
ncbi:MAG: M14 family metallopeptidase [Planctomycetota bacterium]